MKIGSNTTERIGQVSELTIQMAGYKNETSRAKNALADNNRFNDIMRALDQYNHAQDAFSDLLQKADNYSSVAMLRSYDSAMDRYRSAGDELTDAIANDRGRSGDSPSFEIQYAEAKAREMKDELSHHSTRIKHLMQKGGFKDYMPDMKTLDLDENGKYNPIEYFTFNEKPFVFYKIRNKGFFC